MIVSVLRLRFYAPYVHSLKEKRMITKSLIQKIGNQFHVSVAEIEEQDVHETSVLGIAVIAAHHSLADSILDHIIRYVEQNSEAQLVSVEREDS